MRIVRDEIQRQMPEHLREHESDVGAFAEQVFGNALRHQLEAYQREHNFIAGSPRPGTYLEVHAPLTPSTDLNGRARLEAQSIGGLGIQIPIRDAGQESDRPLVENMQSEIRNVYPTRGGNEESLRDLVPPDESRIFDLDPNAELRTYFAFLTDFDAADLESNFAIGQQFGEDIR